jgi:hypothetical protein
VVGQIGGLGEIVFVGWLLVAGARLAVAESATPAGSAMSGQVTAP